MKTKNRPEKVPTGGASMSERSFAKGKRVKRKYDSENSRRSLLKAAIDIFSEEGYDAATTRQIAKKANVNEALIQRYFKSKHGLLVASVSNFHEQLLISSEYPEGNNFYEEMENFFSFRLKFAKRKRKFIRIIITRAVVDPKIRDAWTMLVQNGVRGLVTRLDHLKSKGKIRKDVNTEYLAILMMSLTFSITFFTEILLSTDRERTREVILLAQQALLAHLTA